jgi:hypothetical protein
LTAGAVAAINCFFFLYQIQLKDIGTDLRVSNGKQENNELVHRQEVRDTTVFCRNTLSARGVTVQALETSCICYSHLFNMVGGNLAKTIDFDSHTDFSNR